MKMTRILIIVLVIISLMMGAMASEELETLLQIQNEIIAEDADWQAGITSVSGLTDAEKRRLTIPDPLPTPEKAPISAPPARLMAETAFDWRDEGMITSVKNQGQCGSCWSFPPIAQVESGILIDGGTIHDLSEQHLVSACCGAGSCDGGYPIGAIAYIKDSGVPDEACFPYKATDYPCDPCSGWEKRAWKIKDYIYVESSISDFKWALKEYGPMTVVVRVPDDWYYYKAGIYKPVVDVGWANHAVLLTGWDDAHECWIVKNSWGTGWGEDGYGRVKYGNLEQYNYAYAITGVIAPDAAPDIGEWIKPVAATASSEYSSYHTPTMAIDNRTNTHWFSMSNDVGPSITFNLGELATISKVRAMIYPNDVPMVVNIDVSSDGEHWRTVVEDFVIEEGSVYVETPFTSSRCQYVRMTQTETARVYGTCTEFSVFVTEEEPEYDMSVVLHYTGMPSEVINFIDDGLTGITLMRGNTSILVWYNNFNTVND